MTRFGQISTTLAKFYSIWQYSYGLIYLLFVKALNPTVAKKAIRQILIAANGEILKNNLAIWSHWLD